MITIELYNICDQIEKNESYGEVILSYVSGIHSVMSLFSLLLYDSIIVEEHNIPLSSTFKQISIEEIDHLYFLSRLCYKLGCDPRLWSYEKDCKDYWSPSYNIYTHDTSILIDMIISYKKKLISFYKEGINNIDDKGIKKILHHFIIEEQKHINMIKSP